MKIDNCNCPKTYQIDQQNSAGQTSYQQLTAMSRESNISIKTAEGDTVTFSQDLFSGSALSFAGEMSVYGSMQTFTAESIKSENIGFSVQGDLNEEELADIKHLFKDLSAIAKDFFRGDLEGALKDSFKLNRHMGSISEVNASFSQTTIASLSQSSHYLPEFNAEFAGGFMEMEENQHIENTIANILRAQWQQIADMLEFEKEEQTPGANKIPQGSILTDGSLLQPDANVEEQENTAFAPDISAPGKTYDFGGKFQKHAKMMMAQMARTLEKHPRLSPFAVPLADNAIALASKEIPKNSSENNHNERQLRHGFMNEYANWLMG